MADQEHRQSGTERASARFFAKLKRDTLLAKLQEAEARGDSETVEGLRVQIQEADRSARGVA